MNTDSIIKVSILTENIDIDNLINEDINFEKSNSIITTTTKIVIDKTNKTLDNNPIYNPPIYNPPIYNPPIYNPISKPHNIINSILDLYRKYGNNIVSQHKTKIGFNTELINKSLLQYSIYCDIKTCNSHDIIFYNDNDKNLINTIAFLSNRGFVLWNAKNADVNIIYDIPHNIIANPYKLASVNLQNIGMPDTICHLVENILEIKIYNSRKAQIAGLCDYYDNQLECVKTLIDFNDLGYNANNFKDIENIENFKLLMVIDKCMSGNVGNCRENEIDLYLDRFIKSKMIGIMV
jgi:hypothetical protein